MCRYKNNKCFHFSFMPIFINSLDRILEQQLTICVFSPVEIIYWLNWSHDHHTQTSQHWQTLFLESLITRESWRILRLHGLPSLKSSVGCWELGFLISEASLCLQTSVRSSAKASQDALLRLEAVGLPLLRWQTLVQWRGHPQCLIFDLWPAAGWPGHRWCLRPCLGT